MLLRERKRKRGRSPLNWEPLKYHEEQQRMIDSFLERKTRFSVAPAGRRGGKTLIWIRLTILDAIQSQDPEGMYALCAPTWMQAKRIFWNKLKSLAPTKAIKKISESELYILLKNGVYIIIVGMDKPERIEGIGLNGVVLDEYGKMKKEAWGESIRPALADKGGWAAFIGVPKGRNHYYNLYKESKNGNEEWDGFHWTSEEILPLYGRADEIESAKKSLDPLTYEQEFLASFLNFEGRVYYPFSQDIHVHRLIYKPHLPLIFTFDFNRSPGVSNILQEQKIGTCILGEVHISRNSTTPIVCRKLIQDWGDHIGIVEVDGDATGGAKGSAKVRGSDWDIIEQELRPVFKEGLRMMVPSSNPPERSRVNSVNSRLKNVKGDVRLWVDPSCTKTIEDFEGVTCIEGGSGEIDKSDKELTHHTDGIGYYIHRKFPLEGGGGGFIPFI